MYFKTMGDTPPLHDLRLILMSPPAHKRDNEGGDYEDEDDGLSALDTGHQKIPQLHCQEYSNNKHLLTRKGSVHTHTHMFRHTPDKVSPNKDLAAVNVLHTLVKLVLHISAI